MSAERIADLKAKHQHMVNKLSDFAGDPTSPQAIAHKKIGMQQFRAIRDELKALGHDPEDLAEMSKVAKSSIDNVGRAKSVSGTVTEMGRKQAQEVADGIVDERTDLGLSPESRRALGLSGKSGEEIYGETIGTDEKIPNWKKSTQNVAKGEDRVLKNKVQGKAQFAEAPQGKSRFGGLMHGLRNSMGAYHIGEKMADEDYTGAALEAGKQATERLGDVAEDRASNLMSKALPKIGARLATGAAMALSPSEIGTNAETESIENPMSKEYQERKYRSQMVKPNAPELDDVIEGKQRPDFNIPMEAPRGNPSLSTEGKKKRFDFLNNMQASFGGVRG